ncbi:MAG TPA: helix-turn-helix domain-containing protein [Gemmatimonadales bacterium]|nr:helix-turn-helix domain-containing protein [Gemmatimonadales bacterium]
MRDPQLLAKWEARAAEYEQLGVSVNGASLCRAVLADLERLWSEEDSTELTLQQAAEASGYSSDHLRRLVRTGRVPAQRRGRRLFFRAADLPQKPATVDAVPRRAYDPNAHARQVAIRRSHGGRCHDTQEAA